jgi:hypothetical protein
MKIAASLADYKAQRHDRFRVVKSGLGTAMFGRYQA